MPGANIKRRAANYALRKSRERHVQSAQCTRSRASTSRPKAAEKSLAIESTVMSWATISTACMIEISQSHDSLGRHSMQYRLLRDLTCIAGALGFSSAVKQCSVWQPSYNTISTLSAQIAAGKLLHATGMVQGRGGAHCAGSSAQQGLQGLHLAETAPDCSQQSCSLTCPI